MTTFMTPMQLTGSSISTICFENASNPPPQLIDNEFSNFFFNIRKGDWACWINLERCSSLIFVHFDLFMKINCKRSNVRLMIVMLSSKWKAQQHRPSQIEWIFIQQSLFTFLIVIFAHSHKIFSFLLILHFIHEREKIIKQIF